MTIQCRKVLNGLRKLSSNTEDILAFLGETNYICLDDDLDKTYDYTKYKGEIKGIVRQLVSDGYLKYGYNENYFTLTQNGIHPNQFQWESIRNFLFTSILVPIAVSLITTLLTLLVKALLQAPL